ncbi:type 1 fimbrial protein [Stenotrophomonas sp. 169]|uniref:fimbrial protein n=1 Tax=Stenotrophomonas sp. 169 TaxID=2770322 RepID=UPI001662485B|nr:fimbrial protein [Stenotrophomonas sp. 169]QNR97946.1 type 1 fimbrial protein [Stenotrophomonas sp. 169]
MNLRLAALVSALLLPLAAHAQDGTITFSGRLVNTTCVVTAQGNGGNSGTDTTVVLPTVPDTALATAGTRTGLRIWYIQVGNAAEHCLEPNIRAEFQNGGNVTPAGRLANTGGAGNVEIVVSNREPMSGNPDINLATNVNSPLKQIDPATGWARLSFGAEYYATGRATGGSVTTSVQYIMTYP